MGRAPCCDKNGLKKGPWTQEEDQKLIDYIQKHGYGNWRILPKNAGLQRCGKSCRLRWTNYLRPDIKRGQFSFEEEETIIHLHSILGNKWSTIASRLPGRTDNEIKNYWNTHIRKRLLKMGIDPVTHSPRLDLLDLSSILSSPLYGSSQMNMYPEILKLASLLFSSSHQQNQGLNICDQNNGQEHHNQSINPQIQNQQFQPCVSMPFTQAQLVESNLNPYPSISSDFGFQQHSQLSDWQHCNGIGSSTETEDFVPQLACYNYYGSDCYNANNNNQNMSFSSVLSTPSSSPTTLNSNSTYIKGSSITEDETESFVSSNNNIVRFQIPDMLCVNEFL